MYIYVRIIPEKYFSRADIRPVATRPADTTHCGAPTADFAIAGSTRKKLRKNRRILRKPNSDTALRRHVYYTFPARDYA